MSIFDLAAVLLFGGVVYAFFVLPPQLFAAWAAASHRPAPRRIVAALGVWVAYYLLCIAARAENVAVVIGLGMVAVALPLWLVRLKGEGRLQFTLGGVFGAVTGIAVLLGLGIQLDFLGEPGALRALAAAITIPVTTILSIAATASGRPFHQRVGILGAWIVMGALAITLVANPARAWAIFSWSALTLSWHSLLVVGATNWWLRGQAHQAYVQEMLRRIRGREFTPEAIEGRSVTALAQPEPNADHA